MEIHYNVTGPRRKELATAVGNFIGMAPVYMKAPTYGFAVSNYIIDKNGTLTGKTPEIRLDGNDTGPVGGDMDQRNHWRGWYQCKPPEGAENH